MSITLFPLLTQDSRWGQIAGSIVNQSDLQELLAAKADAEHTHELADISAVRTKSVFIPAAFFIPSTTNGAAYSTIFETSANKQNIKYLDFSYSAIQYAETTLFMPDSWDGGTFTAKFYWTANGGASASVVWGIHGRSYGNAEIIDQAWGTVQTISDDWQSDLSVHISEATNPISLAGTASGGELVQLRIYRDCANASDTLGVNSRLLGVKLEYSVNSWSD